MASKFLILILKLIISFPRKLRKWAKSPWRLPHPSLIFCAEHPSNLPIPRPVTWLHRCSKYNNTTQACGYGTHTFNTDNLPTPSPNVDVKILLSKRIPLRISNYIHFKVYLIWVSVVFRNNKGFQRISNSNTWEFYSS